MKTIEFRINGGRLEYRALIIHEDEHYTDSGCCERSLYVPSIDSYSAWEPVPTVDNSQLCD